MQLEVARRRTQHRARPPSPSSRVVHDRLRTTSPTTPADNMRNQDAISILSPPHPSVTSALSQPGRSPIGRSLTTKHARSTRPCVPSPSLRQADPPWSSPRTPTNTTKHTTLPPNLPSGRCPTQHSAPLCNPTGAPLSLTLNSPGWPTLCPASSSFQGTTPRRVPSLEGSRRASYSSNSGLLGVSAGR